MDEKALALQFSVWLWDNYGKSLLDKTIDVAHSQWGKFNWKQAAKKYQQKIASRYGAMHIFGMSEPVSLEGIFTDVFTLDKIAAFRRFDIQSFIEKAAEQENDRDGKDKKTRQKKKNWHFHHSNINFDLKRKNAIDVINEKTKLFILGKPGAGKTTLLKFIALKASEGKINKIPIFISLKEWSDSEMDLHSFIFKQFEICSFPDANFFVESILNDGKSIVLFDGLDEVNQENQLRKKLVTSLKNFVEQYDKNQYLITCRIAASDYSFENFTYVEVADFNDNQITTFVTKWFNKSSAKKDKFLSEIRNKDNEGIRELASIPLLLTLLCLAFNETMAFPQRRVEIYEEATEALLKKWDTSRNIKRDDIYRKLSLGRKRQLLARIAAETFDNGEYFIQQERLAGKIMAYMNKLPPSDVGEDIDGEIILKSLEAQHGILVERAWKIYSFSHLTFHEYYAARYIADNATSGTLQSLSTHIGDDRWREVLLLTTSLLDNADIFFEILTKTVYNKLNQHDEILKFLKSDEIKSVDNNISIDFPSRAGFLEQDITIYISTKLEDFPETAQKYFQDINYARSCALELATKYKVPKFLLLVLALDLILLFELLNSETFKTQLGLQHLSELYEPNIGIEQEETETEQDSEIKDSESSEAKEGSKAIDVIFSKRDIVKMAKREKEVDKKKDVSLTSCVGSLLAHAKILSKSFSLSGIWNEFSAMKSPSIAGIRFMLHNTNFLLQSLDMINHKKINPFIEYLESCLLICECLDLSYVTDRGKIKKSLLDLSLF